MILILNITEFTLTFGIQFLLHYIAKVIKLTTTADGVGLPLQEYVTVTAPSWVTLFSYYINLHLLVQ